MWRGLGIVIGGILVHKAILGGLRNIVGGKVERFGDCHRRDSIVYWQCGESWGLSW